MNVENVDMKWRPFDNTMLTNGHWSRRNNVPKIRPLMRRWRGLEVIALWQSVTDQIWPLIVPRQRRCTRRDDSGCFWECAVILDVKVMSHFQ